MNFLGIHWVGITPDNGRKVLLSLAFVALLVILNRVAQAIVGLVVRRNDDSSVQSRFWTRQAISLVTTIILVVGILSIWFNNPARLATAFGLISAGLAFALQQVVTSVAGYFVILRGNNFTVGDRISMGGVRGDVVRLGFIQTTIMEMGQPAGMGDASSSSWVHSRQFTGRIVTVSNSKIFADPVFNYTRDFPFIWIEMMVPVTYTADRKRAEHILLAAAGEHAHNTAELAAARKPDLQRRFSVDPVDCEPRVFYRLTDNWLELTLRFIVGTHRIRDTTDRMSRFIIDEFDRAGIGIASSTYDIVGMPPITLRKQDDTTPNDTAAQE